MQRGRARAALDNCKENVAPARANQANSGALLKMPELEIANDTSSEDESDCNDEQKLFRILYKLKNAKKDQAKKQRAKQFSELQSSAATEFSKASKQEVQKLKKQRTAQQTQLEAEFQRLLQTHSAVESLVADLEATMQGTEYATLTRQAEATMVELTALSEELASASTAADSGLHELVTQATQAVEDKISQLETRLRQIEKTKSNDRFTKLFETILLNF